MDKAMPELTDRLEQISQLELDHNFCGIRFSMANPDSLLKTEDVVDFVRCVIDETITATDFAEAMEFTEPDMHDE